MYCRLLLFAYLLALSLAAIEPNIRIGLQKLATSGVVSNFLVPFKTALPSAQYNQLVTVGFIYDLQMENSIELRANCPPNSYSQTGIGCNVTVSSQGNFASVVLSYFVSSEGNFLCGSASHFFVFPPGTTALTKTLTTLVPVLPTSFQSTNALQNYEYLAGISSQDGNFSLTFNSAEFEVTNGRLDLEVSIDDMQAASIEVIIGYLIFDTNVYKIQAFENLQFSEAWIRNNMLVAISTVKSRPAPATPPARRLQTLPLGLSSRVPVSTSSGSSSSSSSSSFTSKVSSSTGSSWNSSMGDSFIFSSNSSSSFSFSSDESKTTFNYRNFTSKQLIVELRRGSLDLKKIDYKMVQLNDRVYQTLMDSDGIVDGSQLTPSQLSALYDESTPILTADITSPFQSSAIPALPPSMARSSQPIPIPNSTLGLHNQIFNQYFETNGFVIKSAANSIDSIYIFELTSLDLGPDPDNPSPSQRAPVFYRSVTPPDDGEFDACQGGYLVMEMASVDLIRRSPRPVCIRCRLGEVFSEAKKACVPPEKLKPIRKLFCITDH